MSINTKDELSAIPGNCTAMVDVFSKQIERLGING